jgi:hypothetical protein
VAAAVPAWVRVLVVQLQLQEEEEEEEEEEEVVVELVEAPAAACGAPVSSVTSLDGA